MNVECLSSSVCVCAIRAGFEQDIDGDLSQLPDTCAGMFHSLLSCLSGVFVFSQMFLMTEKKLNESLLKQIVCCLFRCDVISRN